MLITVQWLALGYAIHAAWDWAHGAGVFPTRVAGWFPPACAVFDFMIDAFVMLVM